MFDGNKLEIRKVSGKGKAVIAKVHFSPGDIIADCEWTMIPSTQMKHVKNTKLEHYWFYWGGGAYVLLLDSNAIKYCKNKYTINKWKREITFHDVNGGDLTVPTVVVNCNQANSLKKTNVKSFMFDNLDGSCSIPISVGSIFNHDRFPNAMYKHNRDKTGYLFCCIKPIEPGDEICTSYLNSDDDDVWFDEAVQAP
ncbi:MAG: SET domain-containing protein-lysine N-methyltransferase [Candidatus Hodarchaeota archaeon]